VSCEFRLDSALERRSLAMMMGDLLEWSEHEKLRQDLLRSMAAPVPFGYAKVTIWQARNADEKAFELLERFTSGEVQRVCGIRPLDALIDVVLTNLEYAHTLNPLPLGAVGVKRPAQVMDAAPPQRQLALLDGPPSNKSKKVKAAEKRAAAIERSQSQEWDKGSAKGAGKGKDKGGKGAGRGAALPAALSHPGCSGRDANDRSICYGFNLGTCTATPPGGTCDKGRHICVLTSCKGGKHSYYDNHTQ
jgi:hypothetical protein